jgi:hypothetical protein
VLNGGDHLALLPALIGGEGDAEEGRRILLSQVVPRALGFHPTREVGLLGFHLSNFIGMMTPKDSTSSPSVKVNLTGAVLVKRCSSIAS